MEKYPSWPTAVSPPLHSGAIPLGHVTLWPSMSRFRGSRLSQARESAYCPCRSPCPFRIQGIPLYCRQATKWRRLLRSQNSSARGTTQYSSGNESRRLALATWRSPLKTENHEPVGCSPSIALPHQRPTSEPSRITCKPSTSMRSWPGIVRSMVNWEWREHAWRAMERGSVRAVVQKRVDGPVWNLHLHELPFDVAIFRYRTPESAMKHATRWLERRPMLSAEEIRRRTDRLFPVQAPTVR